MKFSAARHFDDEASGLICVSFAGLGPSVHAAPATRLCIAIAPEMQHRRSSELLLAACAASRFCSMLAV